MSSYQGRGLISATGSQTVRVIRNGAGTYDEGPTCQIAWVKDINTSDWVRDADIAPQTTSPQALTFSLTTETTDLVIRFDGKDSNGTFSSITGWTQVGTTQTTNLDQSKVSTANSPGAGSTTVTSQSLLYPTLSAISIKALTGTTLELNPVSFSASSVAIQGNRIAQLVNASFSASSQPISQSGDAILEINPVSFGATSGTFQSQLNLSVNNSSFSQSISPIDYVLNASVELNPVSVSVSINDIITPFVMTISDALNSIIHMKLTDEGYVGSIEDQLYSFFGGTGKSIKDRERDWLISQTGISEGHISDLWISYLKSLGYSGSIQDMLKEFWINY